MNCGSQSAHLGCFHKLQTNNQKGFNITKGFQNILKQAADSGKGLLQSRAARPMKLGESVQSSSWRNTGGRQLVLKALITA